MKKIQKTKSGFTPTLILKNKISVSLRNKRGFMMVEVLVGASIIVVAVLAAMSVTQKSISVSRQALHMTEASFLLEEGAENARIARDNAWSNVATLNTSEQKDIFTRTVVASPVSRNASGDIGSGTPDTGTKLITVTVSWKEGSQTVTKTLSFYLTNIFS